MEPGKRGYDCCTAEWPPRFERSVGAERWAAKLWCLAGHGLGVTVSVTTACQTLEVVGPAEGDDAAVSEIRAIGAVELGGVR